MAFFQLTDSKDPQGQLQFLLRTLHSGLHPQLPQVLLFTQDSQIHYSQSSPPFFKSCPQSKLPAIKHTSIFAFYTSGLEYGSQWKETVTEFPKVFLFITLLKPPLCPS